MRERVSTAAEPARSVRAIRLAREVTSTSAGAGCRDDDDVRGRLKKKNPEPKNATNRVTDLGTTEIFRTRTTGPRVMSSLPTAADRLDAPRPPLPPPPLRPPDTVVRFSFFTPLLVSPATTTTPRRARSLRAAGVFIPQNACGYRRRARLPRVGVPVRCAAAAAEGDFD